MDTVIPVDNAPHIIPILIYHKIDYRFEFSISRIPPSQFVRQLDWINAAGYETISFNELLNGGNNVKKKQIILAFDDGFEGIYNHAYPFLKERNMKATIFPVVGYVGKKDDWDVKIGWRRFKHLRWHQLAEMHHAGFEIGSHTLNHPDLTSLQPEYVSYELNTSKRILKEYLDIDAHILSCPFGKCSSQIIEIASNAGYTGIVLVRNNQFSYTDKGITILPGMCIYRTTSLKDLEKRVLQRPKSWFMQTVDQGIGWCAGRTPKVKGPPIYPV